MNKTRRMIKVETLVLLALLSCAVVDAAAAQDAQSASQSAPHRLVLVSLADRQLAVIDGGNVIARFAVAVGATDSPSPTGQFRIVNRVSNPTYYHPGSVIPSEKDNPVGTRWVGLSQKGYGIHGTNAPRSIGHAASHGCIRLRNRDMERLFTLLRIGDVVEIHGERDEQVAQIFGGVANPTMVADAQATAQSANQAGGQ
jgi:lipoprotein-anchoring transpeptidase ErfK/SrfK